MPLDAHPNEINIQLEPIPRMAAKAAKFECADKEDFLKTFEQQSISLNNSGCTHSLLGMSMPPDEDDHSARLCLQSCNQSTPTSTISRWRSRLQGAHMQSVNNVPVHSIQDVKSIVTEGAAPATPLHHQGPMSPTTRSIHGRSWEPPITFGPTQCDPHHLNAIRQRRTKSWPGLPTDMPPLDDNNVQAATFKAGLATPRMTRCTVMRSLEAANWHKIEWTQVSKCLNQGMLGNPCCT